MILMLGEFEYLVLTAAVQPGRRCIWRGNPAGDRGGNRTPLLHRSALHNPGSAGDKRLCENVDGRFDAATGRSGQANGLRNRKGDSGRFRLLSCGHASEPECLMGGRMSVRASYQSIFVVVGE